MGIELINVTTTGVYSVRMDVRIRAMYGRVYMTAQTYDAFFSQQPIMNGLENNAEIMIRRRYFEPSRYLIDVDTAQAMLEDIAAKLPR